MAEPEDPTSIPTEIAPASGDSKPPAAKCLNISAMAAMLGAARPAAPRGSAGWQIPSPEELQADFPQYEIVGVLGRGGMGAVYKGWQKSLDRFVAIKILPPEVQDFDPNFAERFKHEAKAMARLSHPAICPVFDAGETPDGLLYFVMEFIDGGDLSQKIAAQGRFAPAEAVAIAGTICDALQFAHASGIVHRDIKPSNILLNQHGQWKVADFGLAKLLGQPNDDLTLSDTSMGSAGFASPEALTDGAHVDHRADIYAVGVILYEMLTGRIPRGAFEMPSQFVPGLDPRFDAIVVKAMQPDRERRYGTAREMRADLDGIVAVAASTSGTFAIPERVPLALSAPPARRKVWPWIAFAVIVILLAVGGVVAWNRSREKVIGESRRVDQARASAAAEKAAAEEARHRWRPVPNKFNAPMDRGAVHLVNFDSWAAPRFRIANGAVRATILWQPNPPGRNDLIKVTARLTDAGHYYACLYGPVVELGHYRPPGMIGLQRWAIEPPPGPDEVISLQLACVGHRLAVWVRDRFMGTMEDDTLNDAANVGIQAVDGHVVNLEYLDLDGLSEAEAFQRLGLDARGATPIESTSAAPAAATKDAPFFNSLGMKLVPVPITGGPSSGQRLLFSVWETRVQDYEIFAGETKREWLRPDFSHGPTHPAVNVSWDDARAFCAWLTERERKAGLLGPKERYRLPTDHEWSCAVGIGEREDAAKSPEEKDRELRDVFPWGDAWPPPRGAGNYSGEEAAGRETWKGQTILTGYRDKFPETAPVGSFPANRFGLFDLGGNAWEWCEDLFNPAQTLRVMRGASFNNGGRGGLFSALRGRRSPDDRNDGYGFRVVLDVTGKGSEKVSATGGATSPRAAQSTAPSLGAFAAATNDAPFVNSLGIKFVPVPITGGPTDKQRVLFSVWETRVQDFQSFVKETKREWAKSPFQQGPTHPAVGVSWEEAQAFCIWLTERERTAGRLGATELYRLPTDHEWSCAVGIGEREDPAKSPSIKAQAIADVYPWGAAWPPPPEAGNYSGEEAVGHEMSKDQKIIAGYRDGFAQTSPVGSFPASRFGLFDLGGNAWELCEDLWKDEDVLRVMRGASFGASSRIGLLSCYRDSFAPDARTASIGFRVVLAAAPTPQTASASTPQWRDAFAESPLKDVIAKAEQTEQGYRLPANNHWSVSPQSLRSGAVRVRATSAGEKFVSLYVSHVDRQLERVRFLGRTGEWLLSRGTLGGEETDLAARPGSSPMDGQPHELLFARIGGRLRTMLDGHLLHDEADPSSAPGAFVLDIFPEAKIFLEKVEYVDVDGLPEGESLKLIGSGASSVEATPASPK